MAQKPQVRGDLQAAPQKYDARELGTLLPLRGLALLVRTLVERIALPVVFDTPASALRPPSGSNLGSTLPSSFNLHDS